MNDQHENYPLIDSRQLDRLVDGELSDDDRRRLIETLERQPDKWRDCACAFLESLFVWLANASTQYQQNQ